MAKIAWRIPISLTIFQLEFNFSFFQLQILYFIRKLFQNTSNFSQKKIELINWRITRTRNMKQTKTRRLSLYWCVVWESVVFTHSLFSHIGLATKSIHENFSELHRQRWLANVFHSTRFPTNNFYFLLVFSSIKLKFILSSFSLVFVFRFSCFIYFR